MMKILFISGTCATIYFIAKKHRLTYDAEHDTFNVLYLVLPCAVLALVINQEFTFFEILWTFSIYLEAVAIMPQLWMLQRLRNAENFTLLYIFCLGAYRGFYLLNWIYRYFTEDGYSQAIVWVAGTIQTVLYSDFFYHYVTSVKEGRTFSLPAPQ
eukprot:CAMPEP_0114539298 /NCGR_PEP_ID=MMETSP0114-20121206/163_1 /TAXON_ID=31324 /ORGANISM="Goniomonas sp, Strain m" /LENGTH=154 /DNA_ID=CAMNT_0001723391 /DNA_START=195 /DNA_END=659 /DNA_ORIENTATION=+